MADVQWIKIVTDIFDNRKIKQIEMMPDSDAILVIWFKLLCLSGNINESGLIIITKDIPYTDEMLANEFKKPILTIRMALNIFEKFQMIELNNNIYCVSNWEKYQNVDTLEKIREQTSLRVAKHREKQKLLSDCNVTVTLPVTQCNAIELELDKDKDKDKDKKISSKIFADDSIPFRLSKKLNEFMLNNNSESKTPNLQNWSSEFERMIRIDKRDPKRIYEIMEFSQTDAFWKTNILSAKALRDKYDALKLNKEKNKIKQINPIIPRQIIRAPDEWRAQ